MPSLLGRESCGHLSALCRVQNRTKTTKTAHTHTHTQSISKIINFHHHLCQFSLEPLAFKLWDVSRDMERKKNACTLGSTRVLRVHFPLPLSSAAAGAPGPQNVSPRPSPRCLPLSILLSSVSLVLRLSEERECRVCTLILSQTWMGNWMFSIRHVLAFELQNANFLGRRTLLGKPLQNESLSDKIGVFPKTFLGPSGN